MNESRFPWRRAAALVAVSLLARCIAQAYHACSLINHGAVRKPLYGARHQTRHGSIFSRYASPSVDSLSVSVVLVHGLGMSGDYFSPLAERLAVNHRVYMPDLPGHGRSDIPLHSLDIAELSHALLDWMDSAGIKKAYLAGHSMGAQIAIEAVRRQPQRFAGMILIGPTRDPRAGVMQHAWRLLKVMPYERLSLFGIVVRDYLIMGARLFAECRAMMRDSVAANLEELKLPVMLIKGEHDALVPADWFLCLRQETGALQALSIPGKGHAVHYSAPDEVACAIHAFLHHVEVHLEQD